MTQQVTTPPTYDCDTSDYWCSEQAYHDKTRRFGEFIEDGTAYRITDPNTPRPWLNYLANKRFGSVTSNRGLGFTWYKTTLLRITKYDHLVDYLPREFKNGREIVVEDVETGAKANILRESSDLVCVHRPGRSVFSGSALGLQFELTLLVTEEDPCELWIIKFVNPSKTSRRLRVSLAQTWSFAKFGIHTAEDGIPYISTPGKDFATRTDAKSVECHSTNPELPYEMFGLFMSPEAGGSSITKLPEERKGQKLTFHECVLNGEATLSANASATFHVVSGVETDKAAATALKTKYATPAVFEAELRKVVDQWAAVINHIRCDLPDTAMRDFLNVWLKNQLNLVFHFVRSGQNGYRDTLQDVWGYTLVDPEAAKIRFFEILSHQCADGTAPRQFSSFGDGRHDMRRFMDSPVWMARTLVDLLKETGDLSILKTELPFLDGPPASVAEHVTRALDHLYSNRGRHKMCLTGDGDWNDALEGISKDGDAVSVWLTIAVYDAMRLMAGLLEKAGDLASSQKLAERAAEIKKDVNEQAWDGEWYVYGFTGSGKPIGSKANAEGKIHLNSQTWAVFSGLAEGERAKTVVRSVETHLGTPLGPVLLDPPYVDEAKEVGRIARLQPGTFENGSIYQHAVTFHIFACLAAGDRDAALRTFVNLLPTNPENFDARRTSEPYCTGNYYCGPKHPRFGQNFFTWFTGNASWLLRAGFDEILGVKADFDGLRIEPKVPDSWKKYSITRVFRGCRYEIAFTRRKDGAGGGRAITVDGTRIEGNLIPPKSAACAKVTVEF